MKDQVQGLDREATSLGISIEETSVALQCLSVLVRSQLGSILGESGGIAVRFPHL